MASINPFERAAPAAEAGPLTGAQEAAPVPQRHEDVVVRVRELLGKYPTLGSRQLFDLAIRMHPELEAAGFRSFHARYVLPLKREQARAEGRIRKPRRQEPAAKRPRPKRPAQSADGALASAAETAQVRARVRDVLLRLARQVAVAESRADLVDALARVEDMVEEVLRAAQGVTSGAAPRES